ncbi:uncharacterized protein NECHADRAFT_106006 [Fusarium vanettenii 77-13-4]|uniref:Beta-ketoacyl synthase-like N-terminal domain-containing protein n=1 Tax=Fusarium vanettenii (strain ATCC MYA-4622 / CBS 123669 / FGSC 9596 / NRRL 45880 / 77-13-4) TaxID=660122 RepID=C7ZFJ4_FUSV7|nr:uncharacterized protein NECHADRAFT_106006 [Fusarium vanettenii 77-13-4]EEU37252.1 hypothetical protein NECHADRAFT_106006 [Fusarium vanettenii 77-13-4]
MASPNVKFLIGPNKNEFNIHSEIVAVQSSSLANIIREQNGRFEGRPIIWKHVDVDTFIRFCAFALAGDYNGVEPRLRQIPTMVSQPRLLRKTIKLRLTNHGRTPMSVYNIFCWQRFKERYSGHEFSPDDAVDSRTHTCVEVFLCHARMFIFADQYKIAKLRDVAIRKLWIAMVNITFTGNAIPDVTQLVNIHFFTQHSLDRSPVCSKQNTIHHHKSCYPKAPQEEAHCFVDQPAAGAGMILTPNTMVLMTAVNFLSPDGKCFTFDARANGYGEGEGIGVVVQKRL